jgi:tetratricopeptide (TPR) repeat protein
VSHVDGELGLAAQYWQGWCDYALGKYDDAIEKFRLLGDKETGEMKAKALWAAGESAYQAENYKKSSVFYGRSLDEKPSATLSQQDLSGMGWCAFQQEDFETAAVKFTKAAGLLPKTPLAAEAWLRAGDCYYNLHDYPKAQDTYRKCLSVAPTGGTALDAEEQVGWCDYRKEKFDSAVSDWDKLLQKPIAADRNARLFYWSACRRVQVGGNTVSQGPIGPGSPFEGSGLPFQFTEISRFEGGLPILSGTLPGSPPASRRPLRVAMVRRENGPKGRGGSRFQEVLGPIPQQQVRAGYPIPVGGKSFS